MIDPFWSRFLDWHVRTDHRWDVALHIEAGILQAESFARQLGEALQPAVEKAAALIAAMVDALAKVKPTA